jgi:hypothetical protein
MKIYSPQFQKITVLLCLSADADPFEITGVKDTELKLWACYLARKLTDASDRSIAAFFKIDPNYMSSKLEDLAIEFLVNTEGMKFLEMLELAYNRLQAIPTTNVK